MRKQLLVSGQEIKRKATKPFLKHFGIVLKNDKEIYVLHNSRRGGGTIIQAYDEWLEGKELLQIKDTSLVGKSNQYILNQFNTCYSTYNLFTNNCEHFTDCMTGRTRRSEQLIKFSLLALTSIVIYKKLKKP